MHVGLSIFPTDYGIRAVPLRGARRIRWAANCEALKLLDKQAEIVRWARDLA